ncbi:hypothetical protein THASP1DRAFT_29559 [Thamnocephalis sphaerospora]|uniref:F-box domain-containing protein n=1 Tax=Thamnocephalis sphaerospora TaxID=78915 RepID=A0A4P9XRD6_9FUNG|nr:hypothetical protein THASP1DRAFT_29559 [Thamnocephalis sphaerospora]|eukprot:RKP08643.1 hypothetical protein THASP1DRAFT_29559 [Thamnocephalis sphaerospora]
MDRLPPELLVAAWRYLAPETLMSCALVCRRWHTLAKNSTTLWLAFCSAAQLDAGNFHPEWPARRRYLEFRRVFRGYDDVYPIAASIWYRLTRALRELAPCTLHMLNPPADWVKMCRRLDGPFGLSVDPDRSTSRALRLLWLMYQWHDGQGAGYQSEAAGLFGVTFAYENFWSIYWLPMSKVVLVYVAPFSVLVFAKVSFSHTCIGLVRHCDDASYAAMVDRVIEVDRESGCWVDLGPLVDFWERLARDLATGAQDVSFDGVVMRHSSRGYGASRAVTHGVEILVSTVPTHLMRMALCANVYRVRMSLVDPAAVGGSCQLVSRRWIIHYADDTEEHVQGEAVVGEYPVLDGNSICASVSGVAVTSMEGWLRFVPGQIDAPTGEPFEARVAPFRFMPHRTLISSHSTPSL